MHAGRPHQPHDLLAVMQEHESRPQLHPKRAPELPAWPVLDLEAAPIVVREGTLVVETLERIRAGLPFALRALDVDNGSEFVNDRLIEYCLSHGIELTRSRPYRKNDQAWIEQKNGAIVRKLLGYRRFEGLAAARAITRLYGASRLFVNFFQPSFKLASKQRDGAKVTKHYHPPQTPCERLLQSDSIPMDAKSKLREVSANLDPLKLLEEMRAVQAYLAALADGETPPPMSFGTTQSRRVRGKPIERLAHGRDSSDVLHRRQAAILARSGKDSSAQRRIATTAASAAGAAARCHRTSAAEEVATRLRRAWPSPCPSASHGMADRLPAT